jgi:hypothetical protein
MKNIINKILSILFPIPPQERLLAVSIATFTEESFIAQIKRHGRLHEYLYNK